MRSRVVEELVVLMLPGLDESSRVEVNTAATGIAIPILQDALNELHNF